jgi:cellulose synthase/poly-beta-1,6-N-acetylglucosamine synthase-like glycosyltransferase
MVATGIAICFVAWYALLIFLYRGWEKCREGKVSCEAYTGRISVVVAMRDEEQNIPFLIVDLLNQTHEPSEIILVDDHSSDNTCARVRDLCRHHRHIKLIQLNAGQQGKKAALETGIARAEGDVILTTDADCRMGKEWIRYMTSPFQSDAVHLVCGPVLVKGFSFCHELVKAEQIILQALAGATVQGGYPLFCSGANLAFRKSSFHQAGGYAENRHLPSGDDVFLLRNIHRLFSNGIRFLALPQVMVTTRAPDSWQSFIQQRVRWAGKWRNLGMNVRLTAAFVFFFHLLILLLPLFAMNWLITLPFLLALLALKFVLEALLVYRIARDLQIAYPTSYVLLLQIVYPLYVVVMGLLAFRKKTRWKGRIINTR